VEEWVKRIEGGGIVKTVRRIEKDDLDMPNHLLGIRRTLLELKFANVTDLLTARREIMPVAERNRKNQSAKDAYAEAVAYVTVSVPLSNNMLTDVAPMDDLTFLMTIFEMPNSTLIPRLQTPATIL
jgi:DNA polymerase epsilon subunit 1